MVDRLGCRCVGKVGKVSIAVVVLMGTLLVAGCSGRRATNSEEQLRLVRSVNQQNHDFQVVTERKLVEVAESVDRSLAELAAIERTRTPSGKKLVVIENQNMDEQLMALDWNGPVEPLVKKIAQLVGHRARILGKAPAVPILISVSGSGLPVAEVLRNVDLQCGQRAKLNVYVKQKIIELRYHE